jgi:hypothetical protein
MVAGVEKPAQVKKLSDVPVEKKSHSVAQPVLET